MFCALKINESGQQKSGRHMEYVMLIYCSLMWSLLIPLLDKLCSFSSMWKQWILGIVTHNSMDRRNNRWSPVYFSSQETRLWEPNNNTCVPFVKKSYVYFIITANETVRFFDFSFKLKYYNFLWVFEVFFIKIFFTFRRLVKLILH